MNANDAQRSPLRLVDWVDRNHWRAPSVLCLAILTHLAWLWLFGRFTHIDEMGYKGPGLSLITRGAFAITEYRGLDASIVGAVPGHNGCFAVYPALFAGWASTWGFSKLSCIFFDGVIREALVLVVYGIGRSLFRPLPRFYSLAPALLLFPLGAAGRADDLACVFALLGVFFLLQERRGVLAPAMAGASFAVCFMTHPQATFLMSPIYIATLGCAEKDVRLRRAAWFGFTAFGALLVGFVPPWIVHPDLVQNFRNASAHYVGARQNGWRALAFAWRFGKFGLLLALGLALSGFFDIALYRRAPLRWCQLWLGPIATVVLVLLLMPGRHYYYWFSVPWLVVVATGRLAEQFLTPASSLRWPRYIQATLVAGAFALGLIPGVQSACILATLPRAQRFEPNAQIVRGLIPKGSRVVTIEFWPALAADHQVYHPEFSNLTDDDVDYVILTGNGSGAPGEGQGWPATGVARDAFECIHDNLNLVRATLFGVPISRSAYGFGTMIYRRKTPAVRP